MARRIIAACGPVTLYGGTKLRPEILPVMAEASQRMVNLDELQEEAGAYLASVTGAEAGLVTSGASSALTLATAALIAGDDMTRMRLLPDTTGMRNELVIHRAHRTGYDQCYRVAGARFREIGDARRATMYELAEAITDQTVGIVYLMSSFLSKRVLPLSDVCEIAGMASVPVLVDAASMVPPRANLTGIIAQGADLVAFSGGKGIRGPQSSGILVGREPWVSAARINGSPHASLGRGMKVSKEEVVGLVEAVKLFVAESEEEETQRLAGFCERVVNAVEGYLPDVSIKHDGLDYPTPHAVMKFETVSIRNYVYDVMVRGTPPVYLHTIGEPDELAVDPFNLSRGDLSEVVSRLVGVLEKEL